MKNFRIKMRKVATIVACLAAKTTTPCGNKPKDDSKDPVHYIYSPEEIHDRLYTHLRVSQAAVRSTFINATGRDDLDN
jgi:hypothetical protein